ncbi:MAG: hypothetical protein JXQ75_00665 [Phycisphaerae bacterium]|nr:hypothetical protein [Phycisphaerae bacterium]
MRNATLQKAVDVGGACPRCAVAFVMVLGALFGSSSTLLAADCNGNRIDDAVEIAEGTCQDCNANGVPDECDIRAGDSLDADENGIPDECDDAGGPIVSINEVMPSAGGSRHEWIELYVGSKAMINLWEITNGRGDTYTIPIGLPEVPAGSYVVIYFDGAGPRTDDYDLSDGVAVLHSAADLTDFFGDESGQVALYGDCDHDARSIRSFVAYGEPPGRRAADAIQAGIWHATWAVPLNVGTGAEIEEAKVVADRTIGRYPGRRGRTPHEWTVYEGEDVTPGASNPVPRSLWNTVGDGTAMSADAFALGWRLVPGATYQLQLDDDAGFRSPLVDSVLDEPRYQATERLPAGHYNWRVRVIDCDGRASAWSAPLSVQILDSALQVIQQNVLSMSWLRQRKDTNLLCLDGCHEGNPSAKGPKETWDSVHPDAIYVHGQNNCVRASIAMIVTRYGGSLSQDRISYEYFERNGNAIKDWGGVGDPHKDLGHNMTTIVGGSTGGSGGVLFTWALGLNQGDIYYAVGKPSFQNVRAWIDAGRPIMRGHMTSPTTGHMTVIAGYRVIAGSIEQVRLFDPWSGTSWVSFDTLSFFCHYVPPASAPNVRSDEPGIWTDYDGDGIMDWDEKVRFHTDMANADSDGDGVPDKQDIREYVFNNGGQYQLREADYDQDGARKELDPDNDNDGAQDGCEDGNANGKYEPALGETSNFSSFSCNGQCQDACEPNDKEADAYLISVGTTVATISSGDIDHYAVENNDYVDLHIQVRYQTQSQMGHRLRASFEGQPATESVPGTLKIERSLLKPRRHILAVWGETSTTEACYVVEVETALSTIPPDRFDDESPDGEKRNDSPADAAVIQETVWPNLVFSGTVSVDDLNFHVPWGAGVPQAKLGDVDFFTVQLAEATDPGSGHTECPSPGDPVLSNPDYIPGRFRLLVAPDTRRPFDVVLYKDGKPYKQEKTLDYELTCPHEHYADGKITFSLSDPAGRNFYEVYVGYNRWDVRLYPKWFLEYEPPLFHWDVPILVDKLQLVYPLDPLVKPQSPLCDTEAAMPAEYLPFEMTERGHYTLDVSLPDGGDLSMVLLDAHQEVLANALPLGASDLRNETRSGDGSSKTSAGSGSRRGDPLNGSAIQMRLKADDLEPGLYFLKVQGASYDTTYVLSSTVEPATSQWPDDEDSPEDEEWTDDEDWSDDHDWAFDLCGIGLTTMVPFMVLGFFALRATGGPSARAPARGGCRQAAYLPAGHDGQSATAGKAGVDV